MSYRVITLCIEEEKNAALLANVAASVAKDKKSHIKAVHVLPSGESAISMSPYTLGIPLTRLYDRFEEIADGIKQAYENAQASHPNTIIWDWNQFDGLSLTDFSDYIDNSIVSDLVVCAKKPDVNLGSALPRVLVKESSTPVLVIPEEYEVKNGFDRITLAWNETPEAARAIRDSLPFLKQASHVSLVNFSKSKSEKALGADIGGYLGEHDIPIELFQIETSGDVGKDLLAHISTNRTDLLVMGGFGHSGLYHLILGAATPHVLRALSCPIFISH